MEKLKIPFPILVEGKYDKIKLDSVLDANIIITDGFGVFKNAEKATLIRKLAEKTPVICAFDSDNAGLVIRNYIKSTLPKDKIIHVYFPEIQGKERRKENVSKQGLIGVEGMDVSLIREIFSPYVENSLENGQNASNADSSDINPKTTEGRKITRIDLFEDGLMGGTGSSEKRKSLLKKIGLPTNLSTSSMLEVLNVILTYDEYKKIFLEIAENL